MPGFTLSTMYRPEELEATVSAILVSVSVMVMVASVTMAPVASVTRPVMVPAPVTLFWPIRRAGISRANRKANLTPVARRCILVSPSTKMTSAGRYGPGRYHSCRRIARRNSGGWPRDKDMRAMPPKRQRYSQYTCTSILREYWIKTLNSRSVLPCAPRMQHKNDERRNFLGIGSRICPVRRFLLALRPSGDRLVMVRVVRARYPGFAGFALCSLRCLYVGARAGRVATESRRIR